MQTKLRVIIANTMATGLIYLPCWLKREGKKQVPGIQVTSDC